MSTRRVLASIETNLEESMGVRKPEVARRPGPAFSKKDAGRKPLRNAGSIEVDQVVPDPHQPRQEFPKEAIDRLARSIREKGQLSPIYVRWSEEIEKWVIIAGERRWRAARQAGLSTVDCLFHEGDLEASDVLEQQLIENCLREDLQPIEEAKAFARLMALNGWTGAQLADALHVAPSKISRAFALLKLPPDIQAHVANGSISPRSAYELSKLKDEKARRELADKALSGKLTHEQTANAVRQRKGRPAPRPRTTRQVFASENGWKVVVSASKKGTYYDIEQALLWALDEVRHRIANGVQLY